MTAAHPLNRPVWAALNSRQAHVALGDGRAKRFDPAFGIFAAAADTSTESLAALARLVPASDAIALVEAELQPPVPGTEAEVHCLWQMVAEDVPAHPHPDFEIVRLTETDAPDMLKLATTTRPGPFFSRTHQLGNFVGVKHGGALVAMAGERLKTEGFTEVSGVCTAPGHRGLGYAGALSRLVARRILDRGRTPFLHVYAENTRAIALYQALGFRLRRQLHLRVLTTRRQAAGQRNVERRCSGLAAASVVTQRDAPREPQRQTS